MAEIVEIDAHKSEFATSLYCERPDHVENTGSRPITEVKRRRAGSVPGWVTAWERPVLLACYIIFMFIFDYFFFVSS